MTKFSLQPRPCPPALAAGARVALIAPAGPLREGDVERAEANVTRFGWTPIVGEHAMDRDRYFAGSDAQRLEDLNGALRDPAIDAIWIMRGGYGIMRLLDDIDYDAMRRRPLALLGYSDLTALHCAAAKHGAPATYHGPVARANLPALAAASLESALTRRGEPCGVAAGVRTIRGGRASGVIAGGNLAMLAALAGTPYAPSFRGAIVIMEDIGEAIYRVDRMLRQLLLADMLDGCAGIAFGLCTDCDETAGGGGSRTLDDVLSETAELLGVPCVAGLPIGHVDEQWTIPLGVVGELDADAGALFTQTVMA